MVHNPTSFQLLYISCINNVTLPYLRVPLGNSVDDALSKIKIKQEQKEIFSRSTLRGIQLHWWPSDSR